MTFRVCHVFYFFVLNLLIAKFSDAARILGIFPIPAKSHFNCNNAILRSLANAGHEITVITSFPEDVTNENYTSVVDVSQDAEMAVGAFSLMHYISLTTYQMMFRGLLLEEPLCEKIFKLKEFQDMLNSNEKHYDVVFVEIFILHHCFLPVAKKLGIPIIGTVTLKTWIYADRPTANPHNPSYIPSSMILSCWKLNDFYQTLLNVWDYLSIEYFWYFKAIPILENFHENNLQNVLPLSEFINIEPDFLFYNNHPIYLPRPLNPNVAQIGGIHIKPAKPLPQHIQKFIDEAEKGVILVSLGSVVKTSTLTTEMIAIFFNAFAQLPQKVIWKFEDERNEFQIPSNVLTLKWLPQRDILEHKNVIAFMSHCGQGGTYEAIYTAKPVIACPLFGDQPGNAALLEQLEVAVHVDIHSITTDSILRAINTIVNDTKYYDNIKNLSQEFKNRPMTPQESVVFWTEYVIKHNGAHHLKPAATRLNWFRYFLLDVITFVALLFILTIFISYKIIKSLYRLVKNFPKIIKEKYQ